MDYLHNYLSVLLRKRLTIIA